MGAQAIDNSNMLNYRNSADLAGFTPSVGIVYNAGANTVVFTDGSTIPAGDTLKKVRVRVTDNFGGEVRDTITVTGAPGAKTVSTAGLNSAEGLNVMATVITSNGIVADGSIFKIGAAGNISRWDTQKNA
jgi:hypothetical protein